MASPLSPCQKEPSGTPARPRAGTKQELCQVIGSMRYDGPSVSPRLGGGFGRREGWERFGQGVGSPLGAKAQGEHPGVFFCFFTV